MPAAVAAPVLTALRASQHLDILGEVVPAAAYLGNKRGFTDAANHDCGLVAANAGPMAVAVCSSPPASPRASGCSPGGAQPGWRSALTALPLVSATRIAAVNDVWAAAGGTSPCRTSADGCG